MGLPSNKRQSLLRIAFCMEDFSKVYCLSNYLSSNYYSVDILKNYTSFNIMDIVSILNIFQNCLNII